MKVKDYVSVIRDEVNVNITYDGRKITEFKAPYWDTIESDILNLEIREVKYPGKSIIVETKTGRPTIVGSAAELEAAVADENIKFIKLGADIEAYVIICNSKTIDLAGHSIKSTETGCAPIEVESDAVVDIFSSENGGHLEGSSAIVASDSATVNLHRGDYVGTPGENENTNITVFARTLSKVNIYGGYYVNTAYDGGNHMVLYAANDATITCYGGRYRDEYPSPYIADGYKATAIPDTDPVVYQVKSIL